MKEAEALARRQNPVRILQKQVSCWRYEGGIILAPSARYFDVLCNAAVIEKCAADRNSILIAYHIAGPAAFVIIRNAHWYPSKEALVVLRVVRNPPGAAVARLPRAFSAHTGLHPAARKKFWHSCGVKQSMSRPMVSHRLATERSAALRSSALSLEKAFSMGLKSGL